MKQSPPQDVTTQHEIILLGDQTTGKTTLTLQFCYNFFTETTGHGYIVDTYRKQLIIDGEPCIVQLLDGPSCRDQHGIDLIQQACEHVLYSSQRTDRKEKKKKTKKGIGIILLYDITRRSSFEHIDEIIHHLHRIQNSFKNPHPTKDHASSSDPISHPLFLSLVGNKADLIKSDSERQVTTEEARSLSLKMANSLNPLESCPFTELSARNPGNEIDNVITNMVRAMRVREAQARDEDVRRYCTLS